MDRLQIYGIIGNPVRHSLSPLIHNFLFKKYNINAAYHLFEVQENQLEKAVEGIRILGIKGINVTAPYKEKVIPLLDEIKIEAKAIGAVNTVQNLKGRLVGYNTDIFGIEQALKKELKISPKDKKIAILGAGGAARAGLYTLLKYYPEEILIFNRTLKRAEQIKKQFVQISNHTNISIYNLNQLQNLLADEKIDLIINATSGNNIRIEKCISKILNEPNNHLKILDLNYNFRAKTPIHAKGAKFTDGTYMLVAQALKSFYIWTGIKSDFKPVLQLVLNRIKRGNYA